MTEARSFLQEINEAILQGSPESSCTRVVACDRSIDSWSLH